MRVRITLPKRITIAASNTGLVSKTIPNPSPYQGRTGAVVGQTTSTDKHGEVDTLVLVRLADGPRKNSIVGFPEDCLIPV